jgi:hypothetical protein
MPDDTTNGHSPRPLTAERAAIARTILNLPSRQASPSAVAQALRQSGVEIEDKPVQTTMGRMVNAHQLVRVRKGRYAVHPQVATQLREPELLGAA